ncbi:synaptogyrin-1-like [Lingula anatina]|uniref:Synaptogyrin n=1 Tax=Lingula anatina TaxID=7574 RepID=A0A1S3K5J7_LINAN|nr:synaptogyrin-1-like [Lingula anatina]|eukprot:XP_013417531.1 synaptogyrin-1-like [Lingula anatina]
MEGQAYGAGMAGGSFDAIAFIKKPSVILRLFSLLFSIIVFGCISSPVGGYYEGQCVYNNDPNACNYGIATGVIAFMACIVFLILEALFENLSSVQQRKMVVMADMAFSGFWTFLWFVGFCYLTNQWSKSNHPDTVNVSNPQAAIAFSFFSIGTWAGLTVLAVMKYRQGVSDMFSSGYGDPSNVGSSPYPSYPGDNDPYQEPPFSGPPPQSQGGTDQYTPPTY